MRKINITFLLIKTIPKKQKCQKSKWLTEEALQIAEKRRERQKRKVKLKSLSHVRFLATPWTAAYQAPPSMGFSGQEYWSGVSLPSQYKISSVPHSCPSLCEPMDCIIPGFPSNSNTQSWLKLMSIESVMTSNHLIFYHPSPSPPAFNLC